MYKEKVLITSIDVDNHLNLKVSSIFKFLQQVSTNHSEKIHIGKADTIAKGMAWVITRMKVEIYDYPKMNDEIVVTTHPGEVNRFLFPRFYEIYDRKGKLLVSASSIWVVIDMNTRRVLTKPFGDRKFPSESHKDDLPLPEKFLLTDLTKFEDRKVRYNDIDLNGHLNNIKYIEYILDTKDINFYNKYMIKSINVAYEKEVKEGEYVALFTGGDKDFAVKGYVNEKTSFEAALEVTERK